MDGDANLLPLKTDAVVSPVAAGLLVAEKIKSHISSFSTALVIQGSQIRLVHGLVKFVPAH